MFSKVKTINVIAKAVANINATKRERVSAEGTGLI